MKTCSRCEFPKPLGSFVKCTFTKSGLGPHCLECDRNRVAARRTDPKVKEQARRSALAYRDANLESQQRRDRLAKQEKQAWLNSLKSNRCTDCQGVFPACCMDFDHVRGEKIKGVGQLLGCTKERVLEEIAKCDLVCACCHRLRTKEQLWATTSNPHRRKFHAKIAALKEGKSCADCRGQFPSVAMDFDHVQEGKIQTIARMRSASWAQVVEELAKCELVCANCHRIRTQARKVNRAA